MITQPSLDDLAVFLGESLAEATDAEVAAYSAALQSATDAVWAYTQIEDDPTDARLLRILHMAICELAVWLRTQAENREEINSPFTSERLGSYSYNKAQQAQQSAFGGPGSGLFWLDMLFRLLVDTESLADSWVSSENIFNPDGLDYPHWEAQQRIEGGFYSDPWGLGVPRAPEGGAAV